MKNRKATTKELTTAPINSPINCSPGLTFILNPDLKSFNISPASPQATATIHASKNNTGRFILVENFIPPILSPFSNTFKKEIMRIVIIAYISIGLIPVFPVVYPAMTVHNIHIRINTKDKNRGSL